MGPPACQRCGDFGPLSSSADGQLCAACLQRAKAHAAEQLSAMALVRESLSLARSLGLPLLGVTGAIVAVSGASSMVFRETGLLVDLAISAITTGLMGAVVVGAGLGKLEDGQAPVWAPATRQVLRRWPLFAILLLIISIGQLVGFLLCLVGTFFIDTLLLLALPMALDRGFSPLVAVGAGAKALQGQFWPVLGANALFSMPAVAGMLVIVGWTIDAEPAAAQSIESELVLSLLNVFWVASLLLSSVAYRKLSRAQALLVHPDPAHDPPVQTAPAE